MQTPPPSPETPPVRPNKPTIPEMPTWAIEQKIPEKLQKITDRASRLFYVANTLLRRNILDDNQIRLAGKIQNKATSVKQGIQTAICSLQMSEYIPDQKTRALELIQEAKKIFKN